MADSENGERTEEATQQRREEFRNRGQVAQTKELSSVLLLFASVLLMWAMSRFFFHQINIVFSRAMGDDMVAAVRTGDWHGISHSAVSATVLILGPILGVFFVVAFLSSVLQVGFMYNEEALTINWERMNPIAGFKKLASLRAVIEGAKAVIKLCVILTLAYYLLRDQINMLPSLMSFSIAQILGFVGALTTRLLFGTGIFMGGLALMDYLYQRWDLEKEMRMTKQEVKEEIKSREGDPMIKARIKRIQREVASRRMMEEVPKADVIVTNPTHLAVALKYDETMVAPRVIAKGADLVAAKIRELAKEHGIPIVENKPLARAMFKTLKIGQSIPRELYTAVAEVLSYVFKLKRKARRS